MAEYIDRNAFLAKEREWYCKNCIRRTNSKGVAVYEIGEAPCRACDIGDVLDALEDYPAADVVELSGKATPKRVGFTEWKGYRNTRYTCPLCRKYVRNDEAYCHKCGQALMFPRISFTPYVPGEKQEVIVTWPDEPPKEET